jgi:hypothetical protein
MSASCSQDRSVSGLVQARPGSEGSSGSVCRSGHVMKQLGRPLVRGIGSAPTDGHGALAPVPRVLDSSGPRSPKPARIYANPRVRPRLGAPRRPNGYAVSGASTRPVRLPENRGVPSSILGLAIPAIGTFRPPPTRVSRAQKRPPGVHELRAPARSGPPRRPAEAPSAPGSRVRRWPASSAASGPSARPARGSTARPGSAARRTHAAGRREGSPGWGYVVELHARERRAKCAPLACAGRLGSASGTGWGTGLRSRR